MSAWRLLVHEIHRHGPVSGTTAHSGALTNARQLGLIEHNDRQRWRLTTLGLDYCEGRVAQSKSRPGGRRWVATWLRSLPRGLSLAGSAATLPACAPSSPSPSS